VILPAPDMTLSALLAATVLGAGLVEPLRASLALAIAFPLIVVANRHGLHGATFALFASVFVLGLWAAEAWGNAAGTVDDRRIVVDEVAGAIAGAALAGPLSFAPLAAFALLFLGLDRWKPWPFAELERLTGAWGVMADDLVVAVVLGLAVRLVRSRRA
jgi:phosphatidylglycerophosphatase A